MSASDTLPLVHAEDLKVGAYLADTEHGRLLMVVGLHTITRLGRKCRVAVLEDACTEDLTHHDFADLADFRVVPHG